MSIQKKMMLGRRVGEAGDPAPLKTSSQALQ